MHVGSVVRQRNNCIFWRTKNKSVINNQGRVSVVKVNVNTTLSYTCVWIQLLDLLLYVVIAVADKTMCMMEIVEKEEDKKMPFVCQMPFIFLVFVFLWWKKTLSSGFFIKFFSPPYHSTITWLDDNSKCEKHFEQ